jgi:archaellum component FlaG (FlaF/FlaG flagellin family)
VSSLAAMLTLFLCCLLLAGSTNGFALTRSLGRISTSLQAPSRAAHTTRVCSTISNVEASSASKIQKWYILNQGKRAEVFTSDASSITSIIAEAWKSVLVSYRVLEADVTMPSYDCIYEFENVKIKSTDDMTDYEKIAKSIESALVTADPLFQQSFNRKIRFMINPTAGGEGSLVMVLETMRTKSMMISFEEIEYSPDISEEDMEDFSNDLESFPFPTVMDFVSGTTQTCHAMLTSQPTLKSAVPMLH